MNATAKSFLSSKTLWVNVLAIVALALNSFLGFDLDADATGVILAVINLVLRLVTKQPLAWSGSATAVVAVLVLVVSAGCAGLRVCNEAAIVLRDASTPAKTRVVITCDNATVVEIETAELFDAKETKVPR